jgi:hypothetical protein
MLKPSVGASVSAGKTTGTWRDTLRDNTVIMGGVARGLGGGGGVSWYQHPSGSRDPVHWYHYFSEGAGVDLTTGPDWTTQLWP